MTMNQPFENAFMSQAGHGAPAKAPAKALEQSMPADDLVAIGLPQTDGVMGINLDKMTQDDLLILYHEVNQRIDVKSLTKMNLEEDLVIRYRHVSRIFDDTLQKGFDGEDGPTAGQLSQLGNAWGSLFNNLTKMQEEKFTFERIKQIENILVDLLNDPKLPKGFANRFLTQYEERLKVR